MAKRVTIIGAGVSGLIACKHVIARGFSPVVFEADNKIGGLWNHTMETTRLQNVKDTYHFSDFPWPSSITEDVPRAVDVIEYYNCYTEHFDLLPYIKFNSKVISVDYEGEAEEEMKSWELWGGNGKAFGSKGKWKLQVLDTIQGSIQEHETEFLILCIGRFSGLAYIPEFPAGSGPEVFSGKVLHSMDYSAMDNEAARELINGKRVVVIGSSKSAVDLAYECALVNGKVVPCTMIQRKSHWMLPDAYPWGVDLGYLIFNRFYGMLLHKPGEGLLPNIITTLLSPLRWGISKFIESYIRWKLPLKKYNLIPEETFVQYASTCTIVVLPENFFEEVEQGSVIMKKSPDFHFCKEGLILDGEDQPLRADVVIFATGYKGDEKLSNIFSRPSFKVSIVGSSDSVIPRYRQMIHPRIPQLAVIGYTESLLSIFTFEVKCKWVALFLDQTFALPSIERMEHDVNEYGEYMKKYSVDNEFKRACISGIQIWYNDQLCKDMGCNPKRKKGFLKDLFEPYVAIDYNGVAPRSLLSG